jgi:hypothetical protein
MDKLRFSDFAAKATLAITDIIAGAESGVKNIKFTLANLVTFLEGYFIKNQSIGTQYNVATFNSSGGIADSGSNMRTKSYWGHDPAGFLSTKAGVVNIRANDSLGTGLRVYSNSGATGERTVRIILDGNQVDVDTAIYKAIMQLTASNEGGFQNSIDFLLGSTDSLSPKIFKIFNTGTVAGIQVLGDTGTTIIYSNGSIKLTGTSTVWEDDNLDPTSLTGGGSLPSSIVFGSTTMHIAVFNASTVDEVEAKREYPHKAKLNVGADTSVFMVFHCHCYPTNTNTGVCRLGLEYLWSKEGVAVTTSTIIYVEFAASGTAWAKRSVNFPNIVVPNELGSQFHFRFFRDAPHASDTYNSDMAISTIGFHYEIDQMGSNEITVK